MPLRQLTTLAFPVHPCVAVNLPQMHSPVCGEQRSAGVTGWAPWSLPLACLLALLTALLVAAPAVAATTEVPEGEPMLGVELDWTNDSGADFAERLGEEPALLGVVVHLPITGQSSVELGRVADEAAAAGQGLVVTVRPHTGLSDYSESTAADLAAMIGRATEPVEGPVLVRFGPQMNTPWVAWGMQPTDYVAAYRATARALDGAAPDALTVWSPQTRDGYPFAMDDGSPARTVEPTAGTDPALDTNADDTLGPLDDAYSPFYPGDDYVDWVGLSALYDPAVDEGQATPIPEAGLAEDMLGAAEGVDPNGFYQRYAVDRDRPLLLATGAAYRPGGGPQASEVKAAWWDQVLGLRAQGYDNLSAVLLRDLSSADADGRYIDQRLTTDPALAAALRSKLTDHGTRLGPVADPVDAAARTEGTVLDRTQSWTVVAVLMLLAAGLWVLAMWSPRFRRLRYPDEGPRDLRVDLLRGMAILFVVVDHLGLTSLFHLGSQEAIGIVSGAELFVVLAGIILGIVSRPRMAVGMFEAVDRGWSRAGKLYLWALLVPLAVFGLSKLRWLDTTAVTTFSAPPDGPASASSPASTHDLFAGLDGLLEYPADPSVVPRLLGLQFGPWQFNILGLYVILLLVSPFVLHALHRGRTPWVLAASIGCYVLGQVTGWKVLPFQSDDSFPLLAWQLIFVLGLTCGFFWRELVSFLTKGWGRALLLVAVLAAAGFMLLSWNNPFLSNVYDARLSLVPPQTFTTMYAEWFDRTALRPGRLLNVVVLVAAAFAVLTWLWRPINAVLGWLLIPLGRATLYVFIVHVFVIIVITNVPLVAFGNIWLNTGVYVVVILTLWVMVRTRFLQRFIPT